MKKYFCFLSIFCFVLACREEVVKPIEPPINITKFSATISPNFTNLDLGGSTTATINLKNDSAANISGNVIFSITNFDIIDSILLDNQNITFTNGKINFSKTINAKSSLAINLKFIVKKNLSQSQSMNGKTIALNIDTLIYNNIVIKTSNISANIFSLTLSATAFVDSMNSFASSSTAIDSFVVGKSVAEGFRLFVNSPGTAKVEIVGTKNDASLPISHYWITNSTDEDFGVRVSNFNSNNNVIKTKTQITQRSFEINLAQGVNNVVFKTSALRNLIPNGARGLKITLANGVSFTSTYFAMSDSVDLADKIVVVNTWIGGQGAEANSERVNAGWGSYQIYPIDENSNYVNAFPKIISLGMSTEYYAVNYPYLDFTNAKGSKGQSFVLENYDIVASNVITNIVLLNTNYNVSKNRIIKSGSQFQFNDFEGKYGLLTLKLNVFNTSTTTNFSKAVGLDPYKGGWKFFGNPEMEIRATNDGVGRDFVVNVRSSSTQIY